MSIIDSCFHQSTGSQELSSASESAPADSAPELEVGPKLPEQMTEEQKAAFQNLQVQRAAALGTHTTGDNTPKLQREEWMTAPGNFAATSAIGSGPQTAPGVYLGADLKHNLSLFFGFVHSARFSSSSGTPTDRSSWTQTPEQHAAAKFLAAQKAAAEIAVMRSLTGESAPQPVPASANETAAAAQAREAARKPFKPSTFMDDSFSTK